MENKNQQLRELHGFKLIGYSFATFGMMLSFYFSGSYIFTYYVYTIHLDSVLTSIGSTLSMVIGAFSSILFGVVIDNKKPGKFGKRRPFLLYGLPIWFISATLIWVPIWKPPQDNPFYLPTAIWYWVFNSLRAISETLLMIALGSMLPEQSQTLKNRKKVATLQANMRAFGSVFGLAIPMFIQTLVPNPRAAEYWTESGAIIIAFASKAGIIFAGIALIFILIAFFSVDESFQKKIDFEKKSVITKVKDMFSPGKNPEFRKYIGASVFGMSSQVVMSTTVFPFVTYVLLFQGTDFYYYILISTTCKFAFLYIWQRILRNRDLLKMYKFSTWITVVAAASELLFLIQMPFMSRIVLFILSFGTVLGGLYSSNLFGTPIFMSIIDEAAEKMVVDPKNATISKSRAISEISGSYSGLMSFTISICTSFFSFIYGLILQDNIRNTTVLTFSLASMSLFFIVKGIFLQRLKIKLKDHSC
jgi:Na+/melibiose symporter-like transporter